MATKTVDLNRLKDAVGFKLAVHRWCNRRKADVSKVETDADKTRLSLSKLLVNSEEYDAITQYESALRIWVKLRTVPSYFADGIYLVNVKAYEDITNKIKSAEAEYKALVEKFVAVYPDKVKAAREALKDQFQSNDYPDPAELRDEFYIECYWVSFSTPENLPTEFRKAEAAKLEQKMTDAADCITQALRAGFCKLVSQAAETMVPTPGEKPKKFYDSSIEKIVEFIDTFKQRNLTDDLELEKLIIQAKEIVGDPTIKDVRKSMDVRAEIGKKFQALAGSMAGMVEIKKSRRINLED